MKKHLKKILIVLLFLSGLSLLLYPLVANQWNNYRQKRLMNDYDQIVAEKEAAGLIDYEAEWEAANSYNADLLPSILPDSFADAQKSDKDSRYMSCLNLSENGMMGMVEIPKINITLPIFHTTEEEVLQTAAGHLEGSSLPVGGENTHAVISAHRGLPSASLFTDLDKLEKKDHFLLHVLDDTLCYEVDQILEVKPDDTDALTVESGKDLVTLLTCTPYGVNSHRLLVRGHRVPYVPEELADERVPLADMSFHTNYLFWVIFGLSLTAVFSFFLYRRERKLAKQKAEKTETESGPEAQTESETRPEAQTESETPTEPEAEPETQPEPETRPEPRPAEEDQGEQISQEEKTEQPQGE